MRVILGVSLALMLTGCFEQTDISTSAGAATKNVNEMKLATNSPDATVKSWWALKDASMRVNQEICPKIIDLRKPYLDKFKALAASNFNHEAECETMVVSFDRQITKVQVESDTRAVVVALIKNSSPPQVGATLTDEDRKVKEAGEQFKYTLERVDVTSGWKIEKIQTFSIYAKDWQDAYKKSEPLNHKYVYDSFQ